jgi:Flp pilus assembly protein TadG
MSETSESCLLDLSLEDDRGHVAVSDCDSVSAEEFDDDGIVVGRFYCDKKGMRTVEDEARSKGAADRCRPDNCDLPRHPLQLCRAPDRKLKSRRQSLATTFTRFLRADSGVTMIEFALVGPLFLLLAFMIIETGLVLFTQSILDNATRDAARQIRIGQVQLTGDTDGTVLFKTTLCNDVGAYMTCNSLKWNVQSSSVGFSGLSTGVAADGSGNMTPTGFTAGGVKAYVIVQVGYKRSYLVPWLGTIVGGPGSALLVSTVAFQTENYQ